MNISAIEKMLARGKDDALLRFVLGNAYLQDGRPDEAVAHLQAALVHKPDYSAAWKLLGKAYADMAQHELALRAYRDGISAADKTGDRQAAKEMAVFARRARKALGAGS